MPRGGKFSAQDSIFPPPWPILVVRPCIGKLIIAVLVNYDIVETNDKAGKWIKKGYPLKRYLCLCLKIYATAK